ncbi:MAG: MMPL family transporter [Lachnospiraceae bacterium]|nr:MMPL family transporter [Candidatus Equihabitans merdae]
MLNFGRFIARHRIGVIILSLVLLIPAALGFINTRVNYDILYYLPDEIETMQGQDILLKDFGKGAYAIFIVNGMTDSEAAQLKKEVENTEHVASVVWYDSILDDSIPQEFLPEELYNTFHSDHGTLMAVFFDEGTSSDNTMKAIDELRAKVGNNCFLSSMSAVVTDTKNLVDSELFWYVLIAVLLSALVLVLTMDSFMAPVLFLLTIGIAVIYNLGTNIFKGEISFITMSLAAVLQLAVTMDYSIFLWNSYMEKKKGYGDNTEAMAHAISDTIVSVSASSLTTVAGFIALCFMTFTLGLDLGVVMAKGVILGVLLCITVLPAFILCCDKLIKRFSHKPLNIKGKGIGKLVVKHNKLFLVVLMLLWIPALIGYKHLDVYYDLANSLPDYLPSSQANAVLAEDFDTASIEMILAPDDLSPRDTQLMLKEIQDVDGIQFALGSASLLPSGMPEDFMVGDLTADLSANGHQLILIGTEYPVASDEVNAQIEKVNRIIKKYSPEAMLIGEAPCTKDLISITDRDFKVVSEVSIIAIFFLILISLKSITLPIILVLVIELGIYINLGISYFTGTTLPFIASIVIGTIQLGATVDYAILMTTRYQKERLGGMDRKKAVSEAVAKSVPSVLTSALGFFAATIGVGLYSDVDLIGSLCLLMGRGAIISMVLVFLLLPSMLVTFDRLIIQTSWGMKPLRHKNN